MPVAWDQLPPLQAGAKWALLFAGYVVGSHLGLLVSWPPEHVTPLWPSGGLALAALLLWGPRYWPAVFLGSLVTSLTSRDPSWTALPIALGNTLEPLVAAWMVRRFGIDCRFGRVRDALAFLFWAVVTAPLASALIGPPALALDGLVPADRLPVSMALWWLGDAMGILIVAPILLTWGAEAAPASPQAGAVETGLAWLAALIVAVMAFGSPAVWIDARLGRAPITFIVYPVLLWTAIRAGPRGTTVALGLTALVAVLRTSAGHGPFGMGPLLHRVVMLELFLAATSVTMLLLAAAVCVCHRLIADLEEARARADRASREKSRFIAAVRHDLAHPLQAAELFLATLRRKPLPVAARPLLDRAVASLRSMGDTLAALREITTIEAGGEEVHVVDLPLCAVLDQLAEETRMLAEAKGLDFRYVPSSGRVRVDPLLLSRMVRNLLVNALAYTERGRLLLGCRRVAGGVRVEVWDTGPGIPEAAREDVFEAFHRGAGKTAGLGLGLAIVRRLADHMAVEVGVRSSEGRGSCFSITLPLAPP